MRWGVGSTRTAPILTQTLALHAARLNCTPSPANRMAVGQVGKCTLSGSGSAVGALRSRQVVLPPGASSRTLYSEGADRKRSCLKVLFGEKNELIHINHFTCQLGVTVHPLSYLIS